MMNIMDVSISDKKEEALSLVFENCPHIQFGHFVANETILEAFEGVFFSCSGFGHDTRFGTWPLVACTD